MSSKNRSQQVCQCLPNQYRAFQCFIPTQYPIPHWNSQYLFSFTCYDFQKVHFGYEFMQQNDKLVLFPTVSSLSRNFYFFTEFFVKLVYNENHLATIFQRRLSKTLRSLLFFLSKCKKYVVFQMTIVVQKKPQYRVISRKK